MWQQDFRAKEMSDVTWGLSSQFDGLDADYYQLCQITIKYSNKMMTTIQMSLSSNNQLDKNSDESFE